MGLFGFVAGVLSSLFVQGLLFADPIEIHRSIGMAIGLGTAFFLIDPSTR
jgi:hypothetical protein